MTTAGKPSSDSQSWLARAEAGHGLGLRIVEVVARVCGRRVVHWFVAPIAAYFLLVRGVERRASRQFLTRVLERPALLVDCLRHFHTFACVAVDRVFLLSPRGHRIAMQVHGRHLLDSTVASGSGCILLSAHFGSFEAARQSGLEDPDLRLRVLLDRAVNRRLIERLERIAPDFAASIIDASGEPMALALRIGESLGAGEWVGWLSDRYRDGERTVTAGFLGSPAQFPASPFIISKLFRVPVFLVLAGVGGAGYEVIVEPLADPTTASQDRDTYVRQGVERFAERLEYHVRRTPYNWFNFFDFWRA
jgi:predicted LPLAT superfamily acyltransferase